MGWSFFVFIERTDNNEKKIPIDERDRILNKEDEEILKEIAGVYFFSYKKAIEILDNRELGGIEDER